MKTEIKMKALKAAAWDSYTAEIEAKASRDAALATYKRETVSSDYALEIYKNHVASRKTSLEIYKNADAAFTNSHNAAIQAADTANAYEVGDYETNPYEAEDKQND